MDVLRKDHFLLSLLQVLLFASCRLLMNLRTKRNSESGHVESLLRISAIRELRTGDETAHEEELEFRMAWMLRRVLAA